MKRLICLGCLAAMAVVAAPPARAADTQAKQAEAQQAEAQRRLEDAQRRLEQAAREVAELSLKAHDQAMDEAQRIRIVGGNRAVLGVNIGHAAPGTRGVRVISVSPGGPAAGAGVQADDLIVAVDGRKVGSGQDLVTLMHDVKPGQKVELGLLRDGKSRQVAVVARASKDVFFLSGPAGGDFEIAGMPALPHFLMGPFSDAELVPMTPGLGRYFGTDKGLLVVQVPRAAGTDLQEGDVIQEIGGRVPQNAGHALRILGSYQPGETVDVKLLRQHQERTIRLKIPASPHGMAPPVPPVPPAPTTPAAPPAPPAPPAG